MSLRFSRLKNAKNLCLGHRFFDEIRQNPPILLCFQAKVTDSLQKSGARQTVQNQLKLYARRDAWYFSRAALYFCSSFLKIALKTKVVTSRMTRYSTVNDIQACAILGTHPPISAIATSVGNRQTLKPRNL